MLISAQYACRLGVGARRQASVAFILKGARHDTRFPYQETGHRDDLVYPYSQGWVEVTGPLRA